MVKVKKSIDAFCKRPDISFMRQQQALKEPVKLLKHVSLLFRPIIPVNPGVPTTAQHQEDTVRLALNLST